MVDTFSQSYLQSGHCRHKSLLSKQYKVIKFDNENVYNNVSSFLHLLSIAISVQ